MQISQRGISNPLTSPSRLVPPVHVNALPTFANQPRAIRFSALFETAPSTLCSVGQEQGALETFQLQEKDTTKSASLETSKQKTEENNEHKLKEVFEQFVAQTFFGLLLKEMRKSIHKTPYFHGGLAEEIFEQHLDMAVAEKLAEVSGERFAGPMFELFQLQRQNR